MGAIMFGSDEAQRVLAADKAAALRKRIDALPGGREQIDAINRAMSKYRVLITMGGLAEAEEQYKEVLRLAAILAVDVGSNADAVLKALFGV